MRPLRALARAGVAGGFCQRGEACVYNGDDAGYQKKLTALARRKRQLRDTMKHGAQELQRKDVSCPDKHTTKLNKAWARAWVAFGGVGGTADLRGMQ